MASTGPVMHPERSRSSGGAKDPAWIAPDLAPREIPSGMSDDCFHSIAELIDFLRCRVNIGADANAVEVRPRDGGDEYLVPGEECIAQLPRFHGFEVNGTECPGLVRLQADQHPGAGTFAQAFSPALLQVPEAHEFSLAANLLVE